MNDTIAFTKKCYRCDNVVRLKAHESLHLAEEFTCCDVCRAKLEVEAGFAGTPLNQFPKDEALTSPPPPAELAK